MALYSRTSAPAHSTGASPAHAEIQEGLFTILFGLSAYFLLPNTPTSSPRFTAEEKQIILQTLREDGIISGDEKDETYTKTEFLRTFFQPHVLLIMLAGFMNGE